MHDWNQDFVRTSAAGDRYEALAAEIDRSLRFMTRVRRGPRACSARELFASHEALLLDYERALLRTDDRSRARLYGLSGHFLWIGERTRDLDGAHIAFAELLANPIGLKIGPSTTPELAVGVRRAAGPARHPGPADPDQPDGQRRGCATCCPPIVEKVTAAGAPGGLAVRPDARQHP